MIASPSRILDASHERWARRWDESALGPGSVYLAACATTDITQPYHSLSYLAGALGSSGHAYCVRDLAIEYWHYVISPAVVAELRQECQRRMSDAQGELRSTLWVYTDLLEDTECFSRAFDELRSESFYDLRSYMGAVKRLSLLPPLMTLLSREARYRTFSSALPSGYHVDHIDLRRMGAEIQQGIGVEVLDLFYRSHAAEIAARQPCMVGLTIPFLSQLEHSLLLGVHLRRLGIPVALGGPIPAKLYKYASSVEHLGALHFGADYLVPGEGETLIQQMAGALKSGGSVSEVDNLVDLAAPRPLRRIHFEKVDELPAPEYGLWDYSLYASPVPGALYSPTRGCYWNKCSFCDYGLAVDGPTSPWRIRSAARAVDDLVQASQHVRKFFFAVDVLSPAYALKLSRELIDRELDIRWMADFRLESSFKPEKVSVFADAGCVGAAFGMESADQDVLDSIDKGTRVDRLPHVVDAFASVGIPVQLMGFTGFPGETRSQAETTLVTATSLLRKAATAELGKFGLSKGSLVAKDPAKFDIEVLYEAPDYPAIPWDLRWKRSEAVEPIDVYRSDEFDALRLVRGFPFPFLGATSTFHSLLYFERHPQAPFPIPRWGYEELVDSPFYVIPHYLLGPGEREGEVMLTSGLTGRILGVPEGTAQTLDALFPDDVWLLLDLDGEVDESTRELLEFLVTHALAMFLPVDAMKARPEASQPSAAE